MRRIAIAGSIMVLLGGGSRSEKLPPLPAWSPSDFEKVEKGEIVPGEDFFGTGERPEQGGSPAVVPDGSLPEAPPEEESEEFATEISRVHLIGYFQAFPKSYLIDPQELLAQQEFSDRESFLNYHAGESGIDLFVYLFDARQELPGEHTIRSVYEDHFTGSGPVALVFYYLGMAERSELLLSADIRAAVSEDEQNRALRASVQEAFEKSDVAYQLDNFLVELSIRLYWIERELAGLRGPGNGTGAGDALAPVAGAAPGAVSAGDRTRSLIQAAVIWVSCLAAIGGLGWLIYYLADRRIRYIFPEVESGPLLGAPHAAGVGAVISFSSAQIPPSKQRDQVPDYLQKL